MTSDGVAWNDAIWSLPPLPPPSVPASHHSKVIASIDSTRRDDMDLIFGMCRRDQWDEIYQTVHHHPNICTTPMIMDNHISTTILHQAITSKGDVHARANVIQAVLMFRPEAASMKNGYGSLPLHVIAQRNTKMTADIKEKLIYALVKAYPAGLAEQGTCSVVLVVVVVVALSLSPHVFFSFFPSFFLSFSAGGVGLRTPIHVLFTDYVSSHLTQLMIESCPEATLMKDKKGYLPAHVACSRHCSPEKLKVLLLANPSALYDTTHAGQTLLSLAKATATKSHPNFALIDALTVAMRKTPDPHQKTTESDDVNDEDSLHQELFNEADDDDEEFFPPPSSPPPITRTTRRRRSVSSDDVNNPFLSDMQPATLVSPSVSSRTTNDMDLVSPMTTAKTKVAKNTSTKTTTTTSPPTPMRQRIPKRALAMDDSAPFAASLLLHFHRNGSPELQQPDFHQEQPAYDDRQSSLFCYRPVAKRPKVHHNVGLSSAADDESMGPQTHRIAQV